jgi:hypothetical protein
MTFDEWYSRNVAPTLPNDIPPALRQAARESMVACWNAAINACYVVIYSSDPPAIKGNGLDFVEVRAR